MNINAVAAGNIGHAMLNLITQPNKELEVAVLELSSFQLQQTKTFAPDLAIITNLYENHLDYHKDMQEYCAAKCNIFLRQSDHQKTLLPLHLIDTISDNFTLRNHSYFFSPDKPNCLQLKKHENHRIYYLHHQKIYKYCNYQIDLIFDLAHLPATTFDENWLIIIAALDIQNINIKNLVTIAQQLDIPDHRLQKIGSHHGSNFYNDSKSTVWQATLQAVLRKNKHKANQALCRWIEQRC